MPILSIVVATHNRSNYAIFAAKSVLSIESELIELIIHDTSTDGRLVIDIEEITKDSRLHYHYCNVRLSMTENHNRALSLATGEYVCLIGDDDTVTSEILDAVQWAIENNVDAISPRVVANYAWPDFLSKTFGSGHSSRIYIDSFSSDISQMQSASGLNNSLRAACQGTDGLPKIYHGIVKRSVMEKVKEKTGNYFHGVSPDVSGALGIASMIDSFVLIDYPLTIPGAAGNSNTGRSAMNAHRGRLEDDPHIKPYKDLIWPPLIPRFFSVETVWSQAAYETLSRLYDGKLNEFNYIHLYSICLVNHPDYFNEIFNAIVVYKNQFKLNIIIVLLKIFFNAMSISIRKIIRLSKRALKPTAAGGRFFIPDVKNIFEASQILKNYLNSKSMSFKNRGKNV
ncbi:glycosyltransferase family 2 protein [Solimicrobium silvestre]|uniref:Glycosyl transferase family 2 n=1 Tax=Solimicrobium silvestre TaxID=2099400 RepID=A0A2S9GY99_9BURK|nr:glycosyltransferase [Solimicrobium silvestre]PRC92705.1 Glycosyl transferase family 2 [Solimicrobium silvestre]